MPSKAADPFESRRRLRFVPRFLFAAGTLTVVTVLLTLRFAGRWLVVRDPLPSHADVAVMLDGAAEEVRLRRAAAMDLLAERRVDHVLISLPQSNAWDEPFLEIARSYLDRVYPRGLVERVAFCVLDPSVNSTAEEAVALERCLEQHGWYSVVVVTSDFHTRRARMIWRRTLKEASPAFSVVVYPVASREFRPRGWWRQREYAKTWLRETVKTIWILVVGINHWR